VPVMQEWSAGSKQDERPWPVVARMLAAAMVPISLIGFGLLLYNYLRFENPFEFGEHYMLSGNKENDMNHLFGVKYLWFDFRANFLQPVCWSTSFPFVKEIPLPPPPPGMLVLENPFGILSNSPLVWMALAAPLTWQKRTLGERSTLRFFMAATAALLAISSLTLCLFAGACARYQVDSVPVLVLLAASGVLGLERALAANPRWRCVARGGWIAALLFSVVVSLLMTVQRYAVEQFRDGLGQLHLGRTKEAMPYFAEALRINPSYAMAHYYYAVDLVQSGRLPEAISEYEQTLRIDPGFPGARDGLLQAEQKLPQSSARPPN